MTRDRLYSPKVIKDVLDRHGFRFSKGLGQNFLIDGNIVRAIRQAADITKDDYVLEIGPGFGTLTEELLLHAKKVVAVEIDQRLTSVLADTLSGFDNFKLINEDIMKLDVQALVEEEFEGQSFKIVANLPYYITTPIITSLIEADLGETSMTFMVQKEVADRIVAGPDNKQYGSLTLFIDYYTDANIAVLAPKSVFMPQPKVDSAVVHLVKNQTRPQVDEEKLFRLIHAGFNQRRKTIMNSLTSDKSLQIDKSRLEGVLHDLNLPTNYRAENLKLEDFINICKKI